jgi:hypothetical protein
MTFLSTVEAWAGLLALVSYIRWWQGLIVAVVGAGTRVLYRRQAEQARRRTLQMLLEQVSARAVVWQEESWDEPAVTVWIEANDATGQERSS